MIRYRQRSIGVRFHQDCPDYIKIRCVNATFNAMASNGCPAIASCDHRWVENYEEVTPGWWFPVIGFVSDTSLHAIALRFHSMFARGKH